MVLEMEAPEDLRGLARNGLREIAARELRARGGRGSMLSSTCRMPCGCSAGCPCRRSRRSPFEIGMLGQYGLDINDPKSSHVLRSLPGRGFSALQLVCIMYAGFKRIEPGMDIGVDLAEEYEMGGGWQGCRI
jgi:hypothetical protein